MLPAASIVLPFEVPTSVIDLDRYSCAISSLEGRALVHLSICAVSSGAIKNLEALVWILSTC